MNQDPTLWLLARSSGIVAYALLTLVVLAGIVLKARPLGTAVRPALVTDLHRFVAMLSLGALALHGTALVLDRAVDIRVLHLLVPGLAPYRPLWTALGVVAAELMLVVYLSFGQRKRMGTAAWRRLHRSTYVLFALATAHGLMAGTDTGRAWALALYGGSVGAVVAAWGWRMLVPPASARPARPASGSRAVNAS
jgi:sulfoxide reductase heme-binding subunit YedZ